MSWRERLDTVKARLGLGGNGNGAQLVPVHHGPPEAISDQATITAAVDVYENDRELVVVADMPGGNSDAIHVWCDGNGHLILSGRAHAPGPARWLYREWEPCTWQRRLALPDAADGNAATARYRDGVLRVSIPKRRGPSPRMIPVRAT